MLFGAVLLTLPLLFSGCATPVKIESNPVGASVTAAGKALGSTPTEAQFDSSAKTIDLRFDLPGYFTRTVTYDVASKQPRVFVELKPTTSKKSFTITSTPEGAAVTLDGRPVGTTPATVAVDFIRKTENSPWITQRIAISKLNYQSESFDVREDQSSPAPVKLELLSAEREYTITTATLTGVELKDAPVTLDGVVVGKTPMKLKITFTRKDKSLDWPKFKVSSEIATLYKRSEEELTYTRDLAVPMKLSEITEIPVKYYAPTVTLTPLGATFTMQPRVVLGTVETKDSDVVTNLKQVTKYERQDRIDAKRVETINSFTLTPDGQNVIFALSEAETEDGNRYSLLKIKRADDAAGGTSALTKGSRTLDTQPFMTNDGNGSLVFTSNRSDRERADIYFVKLIESSRTDGNPSRLTSDSRFNFYPTYGNSNRLLYYLSMEPKYSKAEIQMWNSEFDGRKPSQMSYVAEQINNSHMDKILYVKRDKDTQKQVIFWIKTDETSETPLITDESFRQFNCFNPCFSTDGRRVLFVSDRHGKDERQNNNIYVVDADGSNLQQLTTNQSDDIQPQWSPTEDGVVYFLSTRGGATNIWRFKLVTARETAK